MEAIQRGLHAQLLLAKALQGASRAK
jgi:hypothetical protein